jgi:alpha-L-fucosidase
LDAKSYQSYAKQFNPVEYDPKAWVAMAKEAGMDYICFTTKHHDGFCMWDTAYTEYKITNTPFGRDVLKELADACQEADMALSLYYSVPDWHHPNSLNFGGDHELLQPKDGDQPDEQKYIAYVKNQVTELLTNYGKILSFFWDIPPVSKDPSVNALIRKLQPGIFINNRGYDAGDFATPERTVPECGYFTSLTEACNSVGRQSWGYRIHEDYHSHAFLMSSIDRIMAMGGNYVLNVGPDALGRIPQPAVESLKAVGEWYNRVKPALFAKPFAAPGGVTADRPMTRDGNTLYIHFPKGLEANGFYMEDVLCLPKRAYVLNNGQDLYTGMDILPTLCYGGRAVAEPVFHVNGIPVNELAGETMILAFEFEDLDSAFTGHVKPTEESRF